MPPPGTTPTATTQGPTPTPPDPRGPPPLPSGPHHPPPAPPAEPERGCRTADPRSSAPRICPDVRLALASPTPEPSSVLPHDTANPPTGEAHNPAHGYPLTQINSMTSRGLTDTPVVLRRGPRSRPRALAPTPPTQCPPRHNVAPGFSVHLAPDTRTSALSQKSQSLRLRPAEHRGGSPAEAQLCRDLARAPYLSCGTCGAAVPCPDHHQNTPRELSGTR